MLETLRAMIQVDVGRRGLAADPVHNLLTACAGDFAAACHSLAETPHARLAIVTGFFIAHATPPAAETDGPLGALFLARTLPALGIDVVLATDALCVPALRAGLRACGLEGRIALLTLPHPFAGSPEEYRHRFAEQVGPLTHLLALERVGPSHTVASLQAQGGGEATDDVTLYLAEVPAHEHDRYHSMRGRDITALMSPAHWLFEATAGPLAAVVTLGIGDGGNEIGMGKVAWSVLRRNIPLGAIVGCRVATRYLVVAGVSNWGAYGLAAGLLSLRGQPPDPEWFLPAREEELLTCMVREGPLVDGLTGLPTSTVDGLAFPRYAEPLVALGQAVQRAC